MDLSAEHWRRTRLPGAELNRRGSFGLVATFGQLSGSGADRLYGAIRHRHQQSRSAVPAHIMFGERGPLLALLDWAANRGVEVAPLAQAFADGATPRAVPLAKLRTALADVVRECAASEESGWALFAGHGAVEPIRLLLPTDPATTLLAMPTAAVGISGVGLRLLRRQITLTGWRSTERGVVLQTLAGERRLGPASLSAQLLRLLGEDAPQVELRRVPLSDLLAPALSALNAVEIGDISCSVEITVITGR